MINRYNLSRQATLKIKRKYGTHNWDMRVNISIFSIIVVNTWCLLKGILGFILNENGENLIDNTMDEAHITWGQTSNLRDTTWGISLLETHDGRV